MRGLEEIRETNSNPHERRDEHFGARAHPGDPSYANRSFESNMDELHRRTPSSSHPSREDAILRGILGDIVGGNAKSAGEKTADFMDDLIKGGNEQSAFENLVGLIAVASILDGASTRRRSPQRHPGPGFLGMEGIESSLGDTPPFIGFWRKLNADLAARGENEVGYREAKIAFEGGPTPLGAITFVGKRWDGLRAIPSEPITALGGKRPNYLGQYREVTDNGTRWHTIEDSREKTVIFACPEAALVAAEQHRETNVARANR